MATRSPVSTPSSLSALAALLTSRSRSLQVGEGDRPRVARLTDPVVGDLVAEPALDVAIDAVVGHVELAAGEPLRERQLPFEGLVERRRPVDPLPGALGPEGLEVGLGLRVQVRRGVGLGGEGRIRRKEPGFGEEVFDLRRRKRMLDAHGVPRVRPGLARPSYRAPCPRATAGGRVPARRVLARVAGR